MGHFRKSQCPFDTNIVPKWLKGKMVILHEILWVCGTEGDYKPGKDPSHGPQVLVCWEAQTQTDL